MNARRSLLFGSAVILGVLFLALPAAAQTAGPLGGPPTIEAKPVAGVTVAPGKKLWVFVFPEHGKGKGGPPSGGGSCTDTNQGDHKLLGFKPTALTFNINDGSIPLAAANGAIQAIHDAFQTWGQAAKIGMTVHDFGGAGGPAEDGNNSIGWVRIVPRNTLAATWVWTTTVNGVEYVTEADVFFNLFQPWGVFSVCNALDVFEVGNVIFHEAGHVFGLDHVSDPGAQATMYPSAPRGEVRKRTLTTGDVEGAIAAAQ